MPDRTNAKHRKRTRGWIGTRVTVCGKKLSVDGDVICLLHPAHQPTNIHASIAYADLPVMIVQDDTKEEVQWLSPKE